MTLMLNGQVAAIRPMFVAVASMSFAGCLWHGDPSS